MIEKVYEIIDEIDKSNIKIRLNKLKEMIKNDKKAQELINKFELAKENYIKYNLKEEFILAKKKLFSNKAIKEYIDIQNEINILMLNINKRLKEITKI